jgi:acetyl-CoA synthetase (ADP-forming)
MATDMAHRLDIAPASGIRARLEMAVAAGQGALDEAEAKHMLAGIGIDVPRHVIVQPDAGIAEAISALRPPYVLKALSREALHKSDIGAVRLGLGDAAAVEEAAADIAARMQGAGKRLNGLLVEEMAGPGIEIVIGGTIDPQLGPMIMLGAGGVFAEILDDTAFRLCPIGPRDARDMVDDLRIAPMLKGARGKPPVAMEAIHAALLALAGEDGLFTRHCDLIAEFDLNPLIARPDGLVAVDARFVLAGAGA